MTTKYHVCWGPDAVLFVTVPDGSTFKTGQPNDETFVVQDEAARRAFELNYTGFRSFNLKEEYEVGEYVTFRDNLYQSINGIEPYIEPEFPEETPIIPTPANSPKSWQLITYEEESDGGPI